MNSRSPFLFSSCSRCVFFAASLVWTSTVFAQGGPGRTGPPGEPPRAAPEELPGETPAGVVERPDVAEGETTLRMVPASIAMGTDLHSRDGERLGDIVDLAIDLDRRRATHVFVMTGGILTLGGEVRVVPTAAIVREGGVYRTTLTKDEYDSLQTYERDELDGLRADAGARLAENFGVEAERAPRGDLTRYTDLSLKTVRAADGEEVGPIDDILVNLGTGDATHVRIFAERLPILDASTFFYVPISQLEDVDSVHPRLDIPLNELVEVNRVEAVDEIQRGPVPGRAAVYQMAVAPEDR